MGERPAPVPGVDPLFTDEDVEEILDFIAYEESLCPGCGHPKAESFALGADWLYHAEALACHACAAMRRKEKHLDDLDGVHTYAVRNDERG